TGAGGGEAACRYTGRSCHPLSSNSFKILLPKLEDVLKEFTGTGALSKYSLDGDIDYEGFQLFMNTFLEVDTPEELCRHLFLSFVKRPRPQPVEPKSI
ncbi:Diacylglycerol kinase beta-like 1, partial [Homarus americanus]